VALLVLETVFTIFFFIDAVRAFALTVLGFALTVEDRALMALGFALTGFDFALTVLGFALTNFDFALIGFGFALTGLLLLVSTFLLSSHHEDIGVVDFPFVLIAIIYLILMMTT